jgi:hypothetical protein
MMEMVSASPAMPIEWGVNKPGMQATELLRGKECEEAKEAWVRAACRAVESARELNKLGLHKQIVNRVLEPFQRMKTVVTTTELSNFFWLRCHKDAQPEINALATVMLHSIFSDNCFPNMRVDTSELVISTPKKLAVGQWHTPYVGWKEVDGNVVFDDPAIKDWETALKVSASCCAQVSYRVLDDSVDKALMIYDRLVNSKPVHASPFEHIASPMQDGITLGDSGVTHIDKEGNFWSGNFRGWLQYRQYIEGNVFS